jgi:hypothetical protein
MEKDPFRPRDDNEDVLGPEFPYLSAIGALMIAHAFLCQYICLHKKGSG